MIGLFLFIKFLILLKKNVLEYHNIRTLISFIMPDHILHFFLSDHMSNLFYGRIALYLFYVIMHGNNLYFYHVVLKIGVPKNDSISGIRGPGSSG